MINIETSRPLAEKVRNQKHGHTDVQVLIHGNKDRQTNGLTDKHLRKVTRMTTFIRSEARRNQIINIDTCRPLAEKVKIEKEIVKFKMDMLTFWH